MTSRFIEGSREANLARVWKAEWEAGHPGEVMPAAMEVDNYVRALKETQRDQERVPNIGAAERWRVGELAEIEALSVETEGFKPDGSLKLKFDPDQIERMRKAVEDSFSIQTGGSRSGSRPVTITIQGQSVTFPSQDAADRARAALRRR